MIFEFHLLLLSKGYALKIESEAYMQSPYIMISFDIIKRDFLINNSNDT